MDIGRDLITKIANYYSNHQSSLESSSIDRPLSKEFRIKIKQARQSFETKNYSEAVQQYSKIVKNYPKFIPALSKLANSYEKMGSIDRAINVYQRIIKLDPSKVRVQIKLGQLMAQQQTTRSN